MAGVDETQAMVIIASNDTKARKYATAQRHDFTSNGQGYGDEGRAVWENCELTPCKFLGEAESQYYNSPRRGIVLTSYHHA